MLGKIYPWGDWLYRPEYKKKSIYVIATFNAHTSYK